MRMYRQRMSGFSLLEALITALVLSVGLLGMAGLQGRALSNNHSAYLRSQVVVMAYDMMDRMRANRAAALAGNYARAYGDSIPTQDCSATCTAAQMASADEQEWLESLAKLPSADGMFSVDVTGVATVGVSWDDTRSGDTAEFKVITLLK
jgi:type IV pilus assembly protein PilV